MRERLARGPGAGGQAQGDEDEKRPQDRDLALVMFPGMGRQQGPEGDGQEHAHEGQRPGEAQGAAVDLRRESRLGHQGQGGGKPRRQHPQHCILPQGVRRSRLRSFPGPLCREPFWLPQRPLR
jgi:hypothetical protein